MMTTRDPEILKERLNDFDPAVRRDALAALTTIWMRGFSPIAENVNMHCHSFCSFNAEGLSPTRLAWKGRRTGLYAMGICDFDVLDGMAEFLDAGELLGLRATVNLETRAFWTEYRQHEINSPGEPGIIYIMGCGFCQYPAADTTEGRTLQTLRDAAQTRNIALIERINAQLPDVRVSYQREVLPQTPTGAPTERHIIRAYIAKAEKHFPDSGERAAFWAPILKSSPEKVQAYFDNRVALEESVRGALAKQGGLGYEPPSEAQFPPVETFVSWVQDCGAIPTITWLDGMRSGEADPNTLLEALFEKGCRALNIIPERNWNLKNTEDKKRKVEALHQIVQAAERLDLPINIGTEMNKDGQPFVDDLNGPVLRRYREPFLRGARIMVGHTLLGRFADCGYLSTRARTEWPDRKARNHFFETVGALAPLTRERAETLRDMGAEAAFKALRDETRFA